VCNLPRTFVKDFCSRDLGNSFTIQGRLYQCNLKYMSCHFIWYRQRYYFICHKFHLNISEFIRIVEDNLVLGVYGASSGRMQ
jgi:hypothetical protein